MSWTFDEMERLKAEVKRLKRELKGYKAKQAELEETCEDLGGQVHLARRLKHRGKQ